jgi:uncharacterized membrane protein
MWNEKEPKIKEEFCGACVAGIGALVGVSTSVGSTIGDRKRNKRIRKILFIVGIVIGFLSIIAGIYALTRKCNTCKI